MNNIWFTADTHFGHTAILEYCNRPFDSVEEMDNTIIDNINSLVGSKDTLYHLGDFAFANYKGCAEYLNRINCNNFNFIFGNHDKGMQVLMRKSDDVKKGLFRSKLKVNFLGHYKEISYNKTKIVLCHYAFRVWNCYHRGAYSLYGHSHGTLQSSINDLTTDVGVDPWNFKPVSIEQINEIMDFKKEMIKRKIEDIDRKDIIPSPCILP